MAEIPGASQNYILAKGVLNKMEADAVNNDPDVIAIKAKLEAATTRISP